MMRCRSGSIVAGVVALLAAAASPAWAVVLPLPPEPHYAVKTQVVEVGRDGKRTDRIEWRQWARMGRTLRTSFGTSLGRLITLEVSQSTGSDQRMYEAKLQLYDGGQTNPIAAPVVNMTPSGGAGIVCGLANGERIEINLQIKDHLPRRATP